MTPSGTMSAEPLVKNEKDHRNKWVAVRRGDVLAEANSEAELMKRVREAQLERGTYVIRYIGEPRNGFIVGVG